MSLTIIPIFALVTRSAGSQRVTLKRTAGLAGTQLTRLTDFYAHKIIPKVIKRPLRTGAVGVLIGTLAYGLIPFIPVELFPEAGWEQMPIYIQMPAGTTVDETDQVVTGIREYLAEQKGVLETYASSGAEVQGWFGGGIGASNESENTGFVVVKLDNKLVNQAELVDTGGRRSVKNTLGWRFVPYQIKSVRGEKRFLNLYGDIFRRCGVCRSRLKDNSKTRVRYVQTTLAWMPILGFQVNRT